MKRLILLRHGLTPWNAERRFQGQGGVGLHPTGQEQAAAAAVALAAHAPVALWSSDLERTVETAAHLSRTTGLEPVLDARLREIHVGTFTGMTYPEVVASHGEGPWDFPQYGGESEKQVAVRFAEAIREFADSLEDKQTGVVVSHGTAIRVGTVEFLGWDVEQASSLGSLDNCGWVELVDRAPGWFAARPWRLAAYNRVA